MKTFLLCSISFCSYLTAGFSVLFGWILHLVLCWYFHRFIAWSYFSWWYTPHAEMGYTNMSNTSKRGTLPSTADFTLVMGDLCPYISKACCDQLCIHQIGYHQTARSSPGRCAELPFSLMGSSVKRERVISLWHAGHRDQTSCSILVKRLEQTWGYRILFVLDLLDIGYM